MVTTQPRSAWLNTLATLLLLPAAYVIVISLLKYGLGIAGPFDASAPVLERWGIKEALGWNINLLILLGPVLAFALAALQILRIGVRISQEQFRFDITLARKAAPLTIAIFSILVIGTLFLYMLGENCR